MKFSIVIIFYLASVSLASAHLIDHRLFFNHVKEFLKLIDSDLTKSGESFFESTTYYSPQAIYKFARIHYYVNTATGTTDDDFHNKKYYEDKINENFESLFRMDRRKYGVFLRSLEVLKDKLNNYLEDAWLPTDLMSDGKFVYETVVSLYRARIQDLINQGKNPVLIIDAISDGTGPCTIFQLDKLLDDQKELEKLVYLFEKTKWKNWYMSKENEKLSDQPRIVLSAIEEACKLLRNNKLTKERRKAFLSMILHDDDNDDTSIAQLQPYAANSKTSLCTKLHLGGSDSLTINFRSELNSLFFRECFDDLVQGYTSARESNETYKDLIDIWLKLDPVQKADLDKNDLSKLEGELAKANKDLALRELPNLCDIFRTDNPFKDIVQRYERTENLLIDAGLILQNFRILGTTMLTFRSQMVKLDHLRLVCTN